MVVDTSLLIIQDTIIIPSYLVLYCVCYLFWIFSIYHTQAVSRFLNAER